MKAYSFDTSYDPYKATYASMPTSASSNHEVKQQYINGHFCYAYKLGILTNGLGIVRSIDFYNKNSLDSHPDIVVAKKSKSLDEDKSFADSKALLPTLKDFKSKHPRINPSIFLRDATFDTIEIYKSLFEEKNLRAYPSVDRGSKEWDETYNNRVNIEKSIHHFNDSFCIAKRKTTNEKTLHAYLLLSGISQLLTVVVADKTNQRKHIRSLKSFIA